MINDDQITALARKYAEEMAAKMQGSFGTAYEAEQVIRFLLRRFCLVEKSRIQEEYQKAQTQIKDGEELGAHALVTFGGAKEALLESLCPEIGKEVE